MILFEKNRYDRIQQINQQLEGMQNVGELQSRLGKYTKALSDLKSEKDQLNRQHGSKTTERERRETERKEALAYSKRVSTAYRMKMEDGSFLTYHAPYGYRWDGQRLVVVPEEADFHIQNDIGFM